MKISVLINNYNYEKYVCDAVKSVLQQSLLPDEIIVVDDGSSDDSVFRLKQEFSAESRIKIISKENNGQLSSFNTGYQIARGDLIFFLDSDDLYKKRYIEKAVSFYDSHDECDFLYCAHQNFGASDTLIRDYENDKDLGFSVIAAARIKIWIGGPTSTISMRKFILDRFMPIPLESDWRIRADDCLVLGSSFARAHKFFLAEPMVLYRFHGDNNFSGRILSDHHKYDYNIKRNILKSYFTKTLGYDPDALLGNLYEEIASTKDVRTPKEIKKYRKIIMRSNRTWFWKYKMLLKLYSFH